MKAKTFLIKTKLAGAWILAASTIITRFCAADDEVGPWPPLPDAPPLPTNAVTYSLPAMAPLPPFDEPPPTIDPSLTFIGLDDDNKKIPPDTYGAVGPNHVVTMLNSQVRVCDRSGTNIYSTVSLSNFWGSVGGLHRAFDPRILYDADNQRWVASAGADPPPYSATSSLLIGVSQTSDPTGQWYKTKIKFDSNSQPWFQ